MKNAIDLLKAFDNIYNIDNDEYIKKYKYFKESAGRLLKMGQIYVNNDIKLTYEEMKAFVRKFRIGNGWHIPTVEQMDDLFNWRYDTIFHDDELILDDIANGGIYWVKKPKMKKYDCRLANKFLTVDFRQSNDWKYDYYDGNTLASPFLVREKVDKQI